MMFEHFEGQLTTLLPLQLPRIFLVERSDLDVDMDQIGNGLREMPAIGLFESLI
jgi:hypothetical protein